MFTTIKNFHKFFIEIKPETALIIKSSKEDISPSAADANFIRVNTPYGFSPIIPGSSLKGVIRSYSESILKGLGKEVCLFGNGYDCGKEMDKKIQNSYDVYKKACYACRMFGNMKMASVVRTEDFFPYRPEDSEESKINAVKNTEKNISLRTGIKINRYTGSVDKGALYETEALTGGKFYGVITLKNPEIWQVLIFMKTLMDINDGFKKIGGQKSRGYGKVTIKFEKIEIFSSDENNIVFTEFENDFFDSKDIINPKFSEKNPDIFGGKLKINSDNITEYYKYLSTHLKEW